MAQSRFDRIAELFEATRALPADEWAPYLEAACPDGPDLRDEILDMLIQKGRAISWFDSLENPLHVGAAEDVTWGLSREAIASDPIALCVRWAAAAWGLCSWPSAPTASSSSGLR